jgi:hypothetical protein
VHKRAKVSAALPRCTVRNSLGLLFILKNTIPQRSNKEGAIQRYGNKRDRKCYSRPCKVVKGKRGPVNVRLEYANDPIGRQHKKGTGESASESECQCRKSRDAISDCD